MMDERLHYLTPLLRTPFHQRTHTLNRLHSWAPWAGYTTALAFDDVIMEYTAIRNAVSVYDLCPMRKYRITGPGALAYLNRLTLRDVAKLAIGRVHYTAWCDEHGKLLDDGTLFRYAETNFLLCCQEAHLPWLLDSAFGFDVDVADATKDIAALSLQGPCSCAVLKLAGLTAVEKLKPFEMGAFATNGGVPLTVSRTGFTGDLGYELWTSPDHALALWDQLFEAGALHGIRAVGTSALNMARIEAGFIITNFDFTAAEQAVRDDRARSPIEMGLEWMIDFDKGHFNGRRALREEKRRGTSKWALVGLDIEGNVSAENSLVYHAKTREVGYITAALWSPAAKRNIALAMLERPYHSEKAGNLWVEIYAPRELMYHKLMVRARITDRPFYNTARRRETPPADF